MQIPSKSPESMLKGPLQEIIAACFDYVQSMYKIAIKRINNSSPIKVVSFY